MVPLGNTVHRQECLEQRDDRGFKFWNFLFICGGLLGFLFVCLFWTALMPLAKSW